MKVNPMSDKSRQADADEIEVTEEMIEAGSEELSGYWMDVHDSRLDLYPEIVTNIFKKMVLARRKLQSPNQSTVA